MAGTPVWVCGPCPVLTQLSSDITGFQSTAATNSKHDSNASGDGKCSFQMLLRCPNMVRSVFAGVFANASLGNYDRKLASWPQEGSS